MDLKECFRKGLIKKTKVRIPLINSLLEISKIKEIAVRGAKIDEVNISAYTSLAYDSLREVLEAFCILNGYKVFSHFCIGELLNLLIKDFNYNEFYRIRQIRNSINYYGKKIEFKQGKGVINKIFKMKENLIKKYFSHFLDS